MQLVLLLIGNNGRGWERPNTLARRSIVFLPTEHINTYPFIAQVGNFVLYHSRLYKVNLISKKSH